MKTEETNINLRFSVKGKFILHVHKEGGEKRKVAEFDNLITNTGLDRIASGDSALINAVQVGSGTNMPATTDTLLQSYIAGVFNSGAVNTNSGAPNYITTATVTYAFGQGAAAGNLSEIGVSFGAASSNTLTSRARILDGGGNPTTITVLSDEFLTVTYLFSIVPNVNDVTQTVSGYTFTIRPAFVGTAGGPLDESSWNSYGGFGLPTSPQTLAVLATSTVGSITTGLSGTRMISSSYTADTYVVGTYTTTFRALFSPSLGAITANSFYMGTSGPKLKAGISPAIVKTASQSVTIVFTMTASRA